MKELKQGDLVNLTNNAQAKVIKELGRGGQGIVYEVELGSKRMALKWYLNAPGDAFYKNLNENISSGSPSPVFLWPEYLTRKERGSFGYLMQLRPKGYYEFGDFLLARRNFSSIEAMINAAMKICDGFAKLHLKGLSYQDLNDGNFFINPTTGDVLICDNDNVMPDGNKSGIMGKARYMAPEVVGGQAPDKYSDRFSLAVILFMLFYGNHPFEGSRVLACPCMTEAYEKKFYGTDVVFIYDPDNDCNRPVRGVHNNVIRRWMAFPSVLRQTFIKQFSPGVLGNPNSRLLENQWKKVFLGLKDMLIKCDKCHEETFILDHTKPECISCDAEVTIPGSLTTIPDRRILVTPNSKISLTDSETPEIIVVSCPGDKYPIQLQNNTKSQWYVETQSGKIKVIDHGANVPLRAGLKIKIDNKVYTIE